MSRDRLDPWFGLGLDAWALGVESAAVIGLRTLRLAAGGAAARAEALRMVQEKVGAGLDLQARAMTGALGLSPSRAAAQTVRHYRRRVRSNLRRLRNG
jgi:hypothetical protein